MTLKKLDREVQFHVAEDSPDIRGWDVYDINRAKIGKVSDLLFDSDTNMVRYASIDTGTKNVLLPIGRIGVDRADRCLRSKDLSREQIMELSAYDETRFDDTAETRHYQEALHAKPVLGAMGAMPKRIDYKEPVFTAEAEHHIKLIEEKLDVGKRRVQTGEVKVTKHPVTEKFEQDVTLRHEEIDIIHHPVNREATGNERIEVTNESIRMPLYGEEVTMEKRPFVKEEIEIRKHAEDTTQHISETVRHEELDVERSRENLRKTGDIAENLDLNKRDFRDRGEFK